MYIKEKQGFNQVFCYACFPQVTSYMSDMCSFLEPMARLIRGSVFVDLFHFYEKGDLIEDPSENRLKQYSLSNVYLFRPCIFMGFNTSCPTNLANFTNVPQD